MDNGNRRRALELVAEYYDGRKFGCRGTEGYRKSTDLSILISCAEELTRTGYIHPEKTAFLDLGCADGRVNVLMSWFVRWSLGVELDPEILKEYASGKQALEELLSERGVDEHIPENIRLFAGSSLDVATHERMRRETGIALEDVDLFYTYITLHDLFGELVAEKAKVGALYLVYGFSRVLPSYDGLRLLIPDVAGQHIAALYVKTGD